MYLVTGATGNVGSNVVAQLLKARQKVRVFVRNADRARHWGDRVQVAIGDFGNPDTFARAIAGVDGVFLLNGAPEQEPFRKLIAAAKSEGDPRVVFLSTFLVNVPDVQIGKLHKDKEEMIRESGLQWKFVRPGAFMTNSYQWISSIRSEGVVYNSTGNGKTAPIAPEDIAAVVIKALTAHNSSGEVFELTGGQLLSLPEQVSILADVLTKPIRCVDVPIEAAVQGLVHAGIPQQVAVAIGQSSEVVRDGRVADVTDTFQRVTGNQPKTFEAWARENASRIA